MKSRIASIVSVTGVLFAGTAAALVNTQVLSDHDAVGTASVLESPTIPSVGTAPPVTAASVTVASTGATAATSAPAATAAPATAAPATAAPVAAPRREPTAFQVGEAAVVTVSDATGALVIVSVVPSDGWDVVSAEPVSSAEVRAVLRSASVEVVFVATLTAGGIVPSVDARAIAAPDTTEATVPTSVEDRRDDREDDDERDERDEDGDDRKRKDDRGKDDRDKGKDDRERDDDRGGDDD